MPTKSKAEEEKFIILGDDPIESQGFDWFNFENSAKSLVKQLYTISTTSGVCCGIVGSWGTGKSSFMKLMETQIKRDYPDCLTVWFTAWDPEGVGNLGNAMVFRFLSDIAESEQALEGHLKDLEKSLSIRKSNVQRLCQALNTISNASPEPATKALTGVGANLLTDLDTPQKKISSLH